MQTTAIGTVANLLPENEVILLTFLISKGYILFAKLRNIFLIGNIRFQHATCLHHAREGAWGISGMFIGVARFVYVNSINAINESMPMIKDVPAIA